MGSWGQAGHWQLSPSQSPWGSQGPCLLSSPLVSTCAQNWLKGGFCLISFPESHTLWRPGKSEHSSGKAGSPPGLRTVSWRLKLDCALSCPTWPRLHSLAVIINNANEVMEILLIMLPLPYFPKVTVLPTSQDLPHVLADLAGGKIATGHGHQAPESEDSGMGPWEAEVGHGRQGSLAHLPSKERGDPAFWVAWRSASGPDGGGSWAAVRRVPKL